MTSHVEQKDLKPFRKSSGISLTEAARHLGVTREHLSRVMHGHRVSARLLKRYSELQTKAEVMP